MAIPMARLFETSVCEICKQELNWNDTKSFFSTSGVFIPPTDPLSQYCDAPLHWNCYKNWPDRPRFAIAHFAHLIPLIANFVDWKTGYLLNVRKGFDEIQINPIETGISTALPLVSYDEWCTDPTSLEKKLDPFEYETVNRTISAIST